MRAIGTSDLVAVWDGAAAEPAHGRLARVLALVEPEADLAADTLGRRNQRLVLLHRQLRGGAIVAVAACPACRADNEFDVPIDAIVDSPAPAAGVPVTIEQDGRPVAARLPAMGDLAALAALTPDAAEAALVALCTDATLPATPALRAAIEAAFEAVDPAGVIRLQSPCAVCGAAIVADVDPATFVATEIDRAVSRALRDVDVIARAYGWSEREILALPPARRARYVAMLSGDRAELAA